MGCSLHTGYAAGCKNCDRIRKSQAEQSKQIQEVLEAWLSAPIKHDWGCHPSKDKHTDDCKAIRDLRKKTETLLHKLMGLRVSGNGKDSKKTKTNS